MSITATAAAAACASDMPKLAIVTPAGVTTQKMDPVNPTAREQAKVRVCSTGEGYLGSRMSE